MARSAPPRFVVRTTVATLIMVAGVLTAVFVGVTFDVRERVRSAVMDKLEAGQRMLSALEQRRARELGVQVATLAENPTLKAAVDTYQAELGSANAAFRREMLATVDRELEKLAARIAPDVLAVTDASGIVLAVAGRRSADWPMQARVHARADNHGARWVTLPSGVFQFASSPIALQDTEIGSLQLAKALDSRYAQELATLSGAATLIASQRLGDREHAATGRRLRIDAVGAALPAAGRKRLARTVGVRGQAALPGRRGCGLRTRFDRRVDARADAASADLRVFDRASARSRSRHSRASGWRARSRGRSTRSRSHCRR